MVELHWENEYAARMGLMALNEGPQSQFATAVVMLAAERSGPSVAFEQLERALQASSDENVTKTIKEKQEAAKRRALRDAELRRKALGRK